MVRTRPFFSPRKLEKLVPSLNFGTTTPSNYVSSREIQRESSIVPFPFPQIFLHPCETFRFLVLPFFFQRLFRRMDSWFETTTSSIFNRFNFARTPSVSLKEEDTNDFVPSSEDGWMIILEERRGWWKCQMFSGERSDFVFCIDIFFFLRKRKWTKIFLGLFYYWYLYIYIFGYSCRNINILILIFEILNY